MAWETSIAAFLPPQQRSRAQPVLAPGQLLLVPAFREELGAIAEDSAKFAAFSRDLILESARILVRYGISSVEAFKQADRQARSYLFDDPRLRGNLTFPELSFLVAPHQHLPLIRRGRDEGSIRGVGYSARISFLCATPEASRWMHSNFPGNGQSNPQGAGGSCE